MENCTLIPCTPMACGQLGSCFARQWRLPQHQGTLVVGLYVEHSTCFL